MLEAFSYVLLRRLLELIALRLRCGRQRSRSSSARSRDFRHVRRNSNEVAAATDGLWNSQAQRPHRLYFVRPAVQLRITLREPADGRVATRSIVMNRPSGATS